MSRKKSGDASRFPQLELPLPVPFPVMEAKLREEVPEGDVWQFEPKWDGFRALIFRADDQVVIQSKSAQPLARYFPELVEAVLALPQKQFVLDGEIVIQLEGKLSFDTLQLRLHPAESRVRKLAAEFPTDFFAFDILVEPKRGGGRPIIDLPLTERRERLERFFEKVPESSPLRISPATADRSVALDWFENYLAIGMDGVMAKKRDERYRSGEREGMVKVKHFRTADCVVGGFRYITGTRNVSILAVGLYDDDGLLHHVGNAGGFTDVQRREVKKVVEPLAGGAGFSGKSPGISRWSRGTTEFIPVDPKLVCEIRYDYFTAKRFRHATKFLRWRPDKLPRECTFDQV